MVSQNLVLLSAYNGSSFIAEQIESVRSQTVTDWQLVVRDDGSTDDTREIVAQLAQRDDRISLLDDHLNVGPWASFGKLLAHARDAGARYVFLCDQDDVWKTEKIAHELARLARAEKASGPGMPILVHSDLSVVDSELRLIDPSWHRFQRMSYYAPDPLRTLLIHNAVVGCTIAMNSALLERALPVPEGVFHDWWLAVCAAAFGRIEFIHEPLVLYRQHSANVVGAAHRHSFIERLLRHPLDFTQDFFRQFSIGVDQAAHLRERVSSREENSQLARITNYCSAFSVDKSLASRVRSFRNSRARPQRALSRVIIYGIVAAYPTMRTTTESSGAGAGD